jgi:hypothetical protein
MKPKAVRYFFDTDGDGHWYLVPDHCRIAWDRWVSLDRSEPDSWECPHFAEGLGGGPESYTFENPTIAK